MLQSLQIGPWTGGLRTDIPVEEVAAHELSAMQNAHIGTAGEVFTPPGAASYGSAAALATGPTLTMAFEFKKDASTTYVLIAAGAALYKYSSGWSAITGTTTLTAGDDNVWEQVNCNGTFVMTNGVDTDAIKWTGTGNAAALDDDARFSKAKHCAWFDNRLWMGNVNGATGQLWFSDTADIETWGATSYFNFGGIITGLVPTQNSLSVHTTDGLYTLIPTGNATLPYHPQKRTDKAGLSGLSCVALPDDTQLMILGDGVYQWEGGATLRKVSPQLDGRTGYWSKLNPDRLFRAFAVRLPNTSIVAFALPYGSSQTNMNHVMFYDYRRLTKINGELVGTWFGPDTGWERSCAAVIDGKLHMGDFDGYLWDHEANTYSWGGNSISSFFETGAPPAYRFDVTVAWISGRHHILATGDYSLSVLQKGREIQGELQLLDLSGNTLTLPDDIPGLISDPIQTSQDLPLLDSAPQCSIRYSMIAVGQEYEVRRADLWWDGPERTTQPNTVDE